VILLDGKKLAQKILDGLKKEEILARNKIRLALIMAGGNSATKSFVAKKKKTAEELGVDFRIYEFPENISTNELRRKISPIAHKSGCDGMVIQLPLPPNINVRYILNSVPPEKDVDVLSAPAAGRFVTGKEDVMPPVAGAVKEFLEEYKINLDGKRVVVIGSGELVGKPVCWWFLNRKINFDLIEKNTEVPEDIIKKADILISGVGLQGFIKGNWIKKGAVVIDAGTSESEGKISGDVDFASASSQAGFLTPVPGGVGPVTVAILFRNLISLVKNKEK